METAFSLARDEDAQQLVLADFTYRKLFAELFQYAIHA
jgi:hypothetical protein